MKNLKRALSLLLSLMLVLGAISVGGLTASAADIRLEVGGVQVGDFNKDDVLGDGTVSYDPSSCTLILNNANITTSGHAIYAAGSIEHFSNLTIILKGTNYLNGGSNALYTPWVDTTIDGSQGGTLKAEGIIFAPREALTIQNVSNLTVNGEVSCLANAESSAPYGLKIKDSRVAVESDDTEAIYTPYKPLIISGSSVVMAQASDVAMYFPGRLTLEDGLSLSYPEGGTIGSLRILNPDGTDAKKAIIGNGYYIDPESNPTEGGTVSGGGLYNSGSTATVTATPNENYRFVNWTENGDEVSTDAEYSFTASGNRELVANFEQSINPYNAIFNANGGHFGDDEADTLKTVSTAYGSTIQAPSDPVRDGYVFTGWDPAPAEMPDHDVTFNATWMPAATGEADYVVNVYLENPAAPGNYLDPTQVTGTVVDGETIEITDGNSDADVVISYKGLNTSPSNEPDYDNANNLLAITAFEGEENVLNAYFKLKTFTVQFVNEDGRELQSSPVPYGETPAYTGETPTKEATAQYTYTFAGWSPEITSVTGEATYTATFTENPVDYKLTWKVDGESYRNETVPFGTEISKPDDPVKEGYTFAWVNEIPATMPAQNVTINGEFTPIEYTATFVDENGETVKTVKFTVEDESITEPAVPEKAGYAGEWEEYTLGASDITIKPVYANITSIQLENYEENSETGYKEDKTFTVKAEDLPEGAEIHWFVNGEDAGTGESYTVEDPTDDYTVQAKVIDKDGNVIAESEEQKVEVKNGFFDRLKAFFAELIEKILGKAIADLLSSIC